MILAEVLTGQPIRHVSLAPGSDRLWAISVDGIACDISLIHPIEYSRRIECQLEVGGVAWDANSDELLLAGSPNAPALTTAGREQLILARIPKDGGNLQLWSIPGVYPSHSPLSTHVRWPCRALIGTDDGVVLLDTQRSQVVACISSEGAGSAAPSGVCFGPEERRAMAVWSSQAGVFVEQLEFGARDELMSRAELFSCKDFHCSGIAYSPSGKALVSCHEYDYSIHPDQAILSPRMKLGYLAVLNPGISPSIRKIALDGNITSDFETRWLAEGDARRLPRQDFRATDHIIVPKYMLTRPVFLSDRLVAVGFPGGDVQTVDIVEGTTQRLFRRDSAVRSLDFESATSTLVAGFEDGAVIVYRLDIS